MAMISLRLHNINQAANVDWLYTNWEVSPVKNFDKSKLIASSYEDRVNKASIFLEAELQPGKKYYARAQIVTSAGAHKWTNLDTHTHHALDRVEDLSDLPSIVSLPHIETDSDPKDHVPTGFQILCKNFSVIGDGSHVSTSYWIETLEGKVIWKRLKSEISKSRILVDDIILDVNKVYRIKAVFHSSSGDTSAVSTKTIEVKKKKDDSNLLKIANVLVENITDADGNYRVKLAPINNAVSATIKAIYYNDGLTETAFLEEFRFGNNNEFIIDKTLIKRKQVYLFLIKYDNTTSWNHKIVNTFGL